MRSSIVIFAVGALVWSGSCFAGVSADAARSVGITPEVLAAAGVSASEVGASLARVDLATVERATIISRLGQLDSAIHAYQHAQASLDASPGSVDATSRLRSAAFRLAEVRDELAAAQQALRALAVSGLDDVRVATLVRLIDRQASSAPLEYRVLAVSDDHWAEVERAFTTKRRRERLGDTISDEVYEILAAARADPGVVAAQQGLHARVAIEAVFAQY
jgi:cob(I)alamin adenosyltransferase